MQLLVKNPGKKAKTFQTVIKSNKRTKAPVKINANNRTIILAAKMVGKTVILAI